MDMQPKNRSEMSVFVDAAQGELSQFHKTYGFHVHGLLIDDEALPQGWPHRTKPVVDEITTGGKIGW
jgi:hypothetical protein